MQTEITKLGIIAGKGALPKIVIDHCVTQSIEYLALLINGQANKEYYHNNDKCTWFALGEVGKVFKIFKKAGIKHIILVGSLRRPNFSELKIDLKGTELLAQITRYKLLGDNNLLSIVIKFIESNGFQVVGIHDLDIQHILAGEGIIGKIGPTKNDLRDIKIGINAAKMLGSLDIGQAVIVDKKNILSVEGAEGTDELIKRTKSLKTDGGISGVLVKIAKPQQDWRVDLPSIGEETVALVHEARLKGIAVSYNNTLIINKSKTIDLANKNKIFLYGIGAD